MVFLMTRKINMMVKTLIGVSNADLRLLQHPRSASEYNKNAKPKNRTSSIKKFTINEIYF